MAKTTLDCLKRQNDKEHKVNLGLQIPQLSTLPTDDHSPLSISQNVLEVEV